MRIGYRGSTISRELTVLVLAILAAHCREHAPKSFRIDGDPREWASISDWHFRHFHVPPQADELHEVVVEGLKFAADDKNLYVLIWTPNIGRFMSDVMSAAEWPQGTLPPAIAMDLDTDGDVWTGTMRDGAGYDYSLWVNHWWEGTKSKGVRRGLRFDVWKHSGIYNETDGDPFEPTRDIGAGDVTASPDGEIAWSEAFIELSCRRTSIELKTTAPLRVRVSVFGQWTRIVREEMVDIGSLRTTK